MFQLNESEYSKWPQIVNEPNYYTETDQGQININKTHKKVWA